ncbi:MAG: GHKL domain-containing protein [Eubacterium sp.]|nr:GHKL domain-containing protein [Eubacterium sp.]
MQWFYLLVYLFEAIIAYMYFSDNYELKLKRGVSLLIAVLLYVAAFAVNLFGNNNIIFNTVYLLFSTLIFSKVSFNISWKSAVFHSSILIAIMLITEILVESSASSIMHIPIDAYRDSTSALIILGITCKVLYLIICKLISVLYSYKKNNAVTDMKRTFLLFLYPIMVTVTLLLLFYMDTVYDISKGFSILFSGISIASLALCCFIFVYNQFLQKHENELVSLKSQNEKNEMNKTFYSLLEKKNDEQRVLIHDIKHHLSAIGSMDTTQQIREYLSSINDDFDNYDSIGKSNNKMLDLILNKYSMLCSKSNIEFHIDIRSSNLDFIDDSDLVSLIGNLMDNALEAAAKSGNPSVSFLTKRERYFVVLTVKNTCSVAPKEVNHKLLSTKENSELHGYGTKSIEKIVRKYDGVNDWEYDNDNKMFTYNIVFNMNEE